MDKSRVCVSRTINLAKQKGSKKTNLLIYEKKTADQVKPPKIAKHALPIIDTVPVKRIRVCTGAELKKMCRPTPCTCPPKPKPLSFLARLMKLLGFGIKATVAAALVYYSWEAGVWGTSEDTEALFATFCRLLSAEEREQALSEICDAEKNLSPSIMETEDKCLRPPFSQEMLTYRVKEKWNCMVTCLFEGVGKFPGNIMCWVSNKFNADEEEDEEDNKNKKGKKCKKRKIKKLTPV